MTNVDEPDKKQLQSRYEHRVKKLNSKDNKFSSKKFQQARKVSSYKTLIKSFKRIGKLINNYSPSAFNPNNFEKVCFILINDYEEKEMSVGPLNDGYLVGLKHHHFGFNIFFLYNSRIEDFTRFLAFFLRNTKKALTVFYSGRIDDSEGIEFNENVLSKSCIEKIISDNCTGTERVMFISDCCGGGSVFDIHQCKNTISFAMKSSGSNDAHQFHGIFTYYFCRLINDCPGITLRRFIERMEASLNRFNEIKLLYEFSEKNLIDSQIFFD